MADDHQGQLSFAIPARAADAAAETTVSAALRAEDVAAYLAEHPDFLVSRPDIVARLSPLPSQRGDGVVDLQAFMVERMRGELDGLRQRQRALISATRANYNTQSRIHGAILFLLDAESFEQLIQTLTTDLAVLLDLDVIGLIVEGEPEGRAALNPGIRVVHPGFIDRHLQDRDLVLESGVQGDEALFGSGAGLVRSQALIRLTVSPDSPACLLVLGSREPDMFHSGMRTELMSFLARVLERCIRSWLTLDRD